METKFINLYGAPGSGKTTCAMDLAAKFKKRGTQCFLLQEYAAYLVLSGRADLLQSEQGLVLAKQNHAQMMVEGKCPIAITDSPLMLCPFYAGSLYPHCFTEWAKFLYNSHSNVSYYIPRRTQVAEWQQEGRIHTLDDAALLDERLIDFLAAEAVSVNNVPAGAEPADWIFEHGQSHGFW